MNLLFAMTLVRGGHVRSFRIGREPGDRAWEIFEEFDQRVLQRHSHDDWHRVERARERFSQEISQLRHDGWQDA